MPQASGKGKEKVVEYLSEIRISEPQPDTQPPKSNISEGTNKGKKKNIYVNSKCSTFKKPITGFGIYYDEHSGHVIWNVRLQLCFFFKKNPSI